MFMSMEMRRIREPHRLWNQRFSTRLRRQGHHQLPFASVVYEKSSRKSLKAQAKGID
jgi:hypothetical protein